ncbi:MAG: DNA recombination protein RmuC [Bacteroides sp.]|nr:DNA recombination protein RmuC [Bacteroides sp.]
MSNSAIIILCIAVLVLSVILTLFISLRSKSSAQISALKATLDERDATISALRQENKSSSAQLQQAMTENARLEERQQFIEKETARIEAERAEERRQMALENERERQRMAAESEQRFKLLARDILDSNTRDFKQQSEQRLDDLLNPLKEELDRFKKSVSDAYSNEARERFALSERIKELVQLNETIGREAKDLTRALRGDSKIQGDWGEMILETLLEKSGLKKGIHFDIQLTTDADGNTLKGNDGKSLRPDAVIYYPDGRCVIIDSKVSLTSYVELINSDPASDAYHDAAAGHLRSVKQHIKELATKNYQDFIGDKRADFVTMFIPNEGAYMAAMNLEPQLWQEAYDQRVLIVSPTHLLSFLRLAEQMWRQDDMKRNVIEIATESGKMYDKFVGFVDDMAKIEKGLAAADNAYKEAMGKLVEGRGNLVRRAEKLRTMGAKTSKSINAGLAAKALPDSAEDED